MTRLEHLRIKCITDKYQGKWLNTVDPFELMLECMSEWHKWYIGVAHKAWMKLLKPPDKEQRGRFATMKVSWRGNEL